MCEITLKQIVYNLKIKKMINTESIAIRRLKEINDKNSETKEYSLGDVLLVGKYEETLRECGWENKDIVSLSKNYYNNGMDIS